MHNVNCKYILIIILVKRETSTEKMEWNHLQFLQPDDSKSEKNIPFREKNISTVVWLKV